MDYLSTHSLLPLLLSHLLRAPFLATTSSLTLSNTRALDARRAVRHQSRQSRASTLQTLDESLCDGIRTSGARMGVVIRKVRVDDRLAQGLEDVCGVLAMIHKGSVASCGGGRRSRVRGEAAGAVGEGAGFPGIVGRGRGDDDLCALCDEQLRGVGEVGWVREHGLGDAVVGCLAGL